MMKRSLDSSDSLGALISICPSTDPAEEHSPGGGADNHVYSRELELGSMLDEEGAMEEGGFVRAEKKRRLSVEQVKALEKHFEVENKLEPERKTKLAHDLGLQPRQVAVWFQNRRARWKTKQLEKDYGILKSTFDSLRDEFHSLQQENQSLKQKIRELKSKLGEENTEGGVSIKEEGEAVVAKAGATPAATTMASESDSSAVLNSPISGSNDDGSLITQQVMMAASSINYLNPSESSGGDVLPLFVKMEEHDFLGEEGCNFFPEDEAPSLHWYCSPDDQWTS